jgi:hypothetical protein
LISSSISKVEFTTGKAIVQNLPNWVWSGIIGLLVGVAGTGTVVFKFYPVCPNQNIALVDPPKEGEDVSIIVRDSKNKQALGAVELEITFQKGVFPGKTLDDGTYRFQIPKQSLGSVKIILRKEGFQQKEIPLDFSVNPNEPKVIYLDSISGANPGASPITGVSNDSSVLLMSEAKCDYGTSDPTNSRFVTGSTANIIINNQPYKSDVYMYTYRTHWLKIACLIDSKKYNKLKLKIGVPDQDIVNNPDMDVKIYKSGIIQESFKDIVPGKLIDREINFSDKNGTNDNITIELVCKKTNHTCNIYFL